MRFEYKVKDQGCRMDGEKLFCLVVVDRDGPKNGLPTYLCTTTFDDVTQHEINKIKEALSA